MSIVHELGGSFFHNIPDLLFIVHVRRCMMIQDIYISTYHLCTWDGETRKIKIPVWECWSFIRDRERRRERSRIEMPLEEVRSGRVSEWLESEYILEST